LNRGKEERERIINMEIIANERREEEKNKIQVKREKDRTIPYSDRKIRTNETDPNSTLNPEMSSDSPSEKSKGERLISAKIEMTQSGMTMR